MKKLSLSIAWLLMSVFAFAQTASINGPNHLCEGENNHWMYAQITGGIQTTDTLIWLQSINSGPAVVILDTTGNLTSVIIPRDPVTLNLTPAVLGNTYSYSLIIKRGTNTYYAMTNVTVIPMPTITLTASPFSLCPGQSTTLHVTGGTDYTWSNGLSNAATHVVVLDSSTTYTVWAWDLTHTCWGANASVNVLVNSPPMVAITSNAPICSGSLLHLMATNDPTYTYSWTGPNGPVASMPSFPNNVVLPSTTSADLGTYTVTVFDGNCSSSASFNVTSLSAPIVNITSAGGANTVCPGGSLQLYANSSTSPVQYDWSTGESSMSIMVYPLTSPRTYTAIVSDLISGCSTTASFIVYIQALPVAFNITGNTSYCPSQFGVVVGLDSSQTGVTYKLWHSGGQIGTALGTGHAISFGMVSNANGTYTATGETNLGCLSSMTGILNVTSSSVPNAAGPITGLTSLCTGSGNPSYSVAPITGATSYLWNITNGYITSSPVDSNVVTIHWVNSGTVTVSGQNSCGNGPPSPTVNVQLNQIPVVNIWPLNPHICPGDTVVLNGTGASSLNWSGPNGLHTGNTYSATTGGILSLIGISSSGCMSQSVTTTITLDSIPTFSGVGPIGPICAGSLLQLTATAHPSSSYHWTGPSGFSSTLQNPSITNVTTSNTGLYSITATSAYGCTATTNVNVVVNATPIVTCSAISPICSGGTIQLLVAQNGSYVVWTGPNGFSSTVQNPSITNASIAMTGWYKATVYLGTCSASDSVWVLVNVAPNLSASATPTSVCAGQPVTLTATGAATYSWNTGQTGAQITVNPAQTTSYVVTGTNSNGCTASTSVTVTTNGNVLQSQFTSYGMPKCPNGNDGWANLSVINGNSPYNYLWTPSPGNGQGSSAIAGLYAGTYTVLITDNNGCHGTNSITITDPDNIIITPIVNGQMVSVSVTGGTLLLPGDTYQYNWIPYPTSGQGTNTAIFGSGITTVTLTVTDGHYCQQSLVIPLNTAGIEDISAANISIYPNPVSDILYIERSNINIKNIQLFDVTGRLVLSADGMEKQINLVGFPTGLYMAVLTTKDGKAYRSKIVKK